MVTRQYFGYGPTLKNRKIIKEIIGRDPGEGRSAVIRGFQLGYQSLSQIPESVSNKLLQFWGESFRAYTLVKGPGVVSGIVWEITDEEFIKLQQWNFVGEWRMMTKNIVILDDNTEIAVDMDITPPTQSIEGIIKNGMKELPNPLLEALLEGKKKLKDYKEGMEEDVTKTREVLRMIAQRKYDNTRTYA